MIQFIYFFNFAFNFSMNYIIKHLNFMFIFSFVLFYIPTLMHAYNSLVNSDIQLVFTFEYRPLVNIGH